jgi:hypothetical protein
VHTPAERPSPRSHARGVKARELLRANDLDIGTSRRDARGDPGRPRHHEHAARRADRRHPVRDTNPKPHSADPPGPGRTPDHNKHGARGRHRPSGRRARHPRPADGTPVRTRHSLLGARHPPEGRGGRPEPHTPRRPRTVPGPVHRTSCNARQRHIHTTTRSTPSPPCSAPPSRSSPRPSSTPPTDGAGTPKLKGEGSAALCATRAGRSVVCHGDRTKCRHEAAAADLPATGRGGGADVIPESTSRIVVPGAGVGSMST